MKNRRTTSEAPEKAGARRIPDAELDVLACLWRHGEATARQVREMMNPYRSMAHGSVVTLLNRLQQKGLVTREKGPVGKAFLYRPTRRPAPTYRRVVGDMLQRIFGGNSLALISSLFETQPPSQTEIKELQELLDSLRRKTGREDKER